MDVVSVKRGDIDEHQIARFLTAWDHLFDPPFTERVRNRGGAASIDEYVQKLCTLGEVLVAVEDGQICGLIGFYSNDTATREAYISVLLVAGDRAGRGIGPRLLRGCIDIVESKGFRGIVVKTWPGNRAAAALYGKHGFVTVSADDRNIVFKKPIPDHP